MPVRRLSLRTVIPTLRTFLTEIVRTTEIGRRGRGDGGVATRAVKTSECINLRQLPCSKNSFLPRIQNVQRRGKVEITRADVDTALKNERRNVRPRKVPQERV